MKNKNILERAYGYLGSYGANIKKDYPASLGYFDKVIELDPDNNDAIRYSEILHKWNDGEREASK